MDLGGDMPVTLVIKAPNQRMADQTVDCMLGWTIRKLKQHLETVYPSKPKHNEQKLIYSGRLLQDHLTLKEILRQFEGVEAPGQHTVHLVCSNPSGESSPPHSSLSKTRSPPLQGMAAGQRNEPPSSEASTDGVRRRPGRGGQDSNSTNHGANPDATSPVENGQTDLGSVPGFHGYASGVFPTYPAATDAPGTFQASTPEQLQWMMQQQAYSQYMAQYMQYYQTMYYQGQGLNPQMMVGNPYFQQYMSAMAAASPYMQQYQLHHQHLQQQGTPEAPHVNAPAAAGAAGGAAPAAPPEGANANRAGAQQRPNNVRMNAQGGMEDDEEEGEPRDWLHHVYFLMRFLTFMGIVFFYSTVTRFLIVFVGSFFIFLMQKARKHIQRTQREQRERQERLERENREREERERQQNEQGNDTEASAAANSGPTNAEGNPDDERPNEAVAGGQQEAEGEEQQPGAPQDPALAPEDGRSLIGTFLFLFNTIQTFFTSLLPTPPELLEAN